jgi:hypothetical protein
MLKAEDLTRVCDFNNACRNSKMVVPSKKNGIPEKSSKQEAGGFISYESSEDPETGEILYKYDLK